MRNVIQAQAFYLFLTYRSLKSEQRDKITLWRKTICPSGVDCVKFHLKKLFAYPSGGPVKVYFWGTRGSLPASYPAETIRQKINEAVRAFYDLHRRAMKGGEIIEFDKETPGGLPFSTTGGYGSNTSCVEIIGGEEYVLCDAGVGLRDFGNFILKSGKLAGKSKPVIFHLFLSHLHWDHIQGFPFFTPAYIPGNQVCIYGFHKELEQAFIRQQEYPFFPIPLKDMQADIRFRVLEVDQEHDIAGFKITGIKQNHPGVSYGYRFAKDGKSIVYSTDSEHKQNAYENNYSFLDFFKEADLLIFDAQYILLEGSDAKADWGHSNNMMAVELSVRSGVRRLCLFHNEPTLSDEELDKVLTETRRYLKHYAPSSSLLVDIAYDGFLVDI